MRAYSWFVLKRFTQDRQIGVAPDTSYHPIAKAPAGLAERPIVIGFGPGSRAIGTTPRKSRSSTSTPSAIRFEPGS